MTARRAIFKQADATRALRAAKAAGFRPTGYKIDPTGAIVVMLADGASAKSASANPWDEELLR
ncbi:hypothetical protein [Sphingobium sp.]|uniref:hypothetical protein n=1 Tax=Sphingobium sp. TaxID=1912891 RepID=UPI003BB4BEBD